MILKEEFDQILIQYGRDSYLKRRRDEKAAGPYMVVDGGMYETTVERWTSYRVLKKGAWPSRYLDPKDEGFITDADAVFYYQAEAVPKTSDIIIDETPHERNNREVYVINRSIPYYIGNNLVYFGAYCTRIMPVS